MLIVKLSGLSSGITGTKGDGVTVGVGGTEGLAVAGIEGVGVTAMVGLGVARQASAQAVTAMYINAWKSTVFIVLSSFW